MVNDIVNGIVTKLASTFDESIVIYTEGAQKDLAAPCFFVKVQKANRKRMMSNRYYLEHSFELMYYPGTVNKNSEMLNIAARLPELEYIMSGEKLLHGTKLNYEIIDEILHFYLQYNCFAYISEVEVEKMQSLTVKNEIGG